MLFRYHVGKIGISVVGGAEFVPLALMPFTERGGWGWGKKKGIKNPSQDGQLVVCCCAPAVYNTVQGTKGTCVHTLGRGANTRRTLRRQAGRRVWAACAPGGASILGTCRPNTCRRQVHREAARGQTHAHVLAGKGRVHASLHCDCARVPT